MLYVLANDASNLGTVADTYVLPKQRTNRVPKLWFRLRLVFPHRMLPLVRWENPDFVNSDAFVNTVHPHSGPHTI